MIRPEPSPSPLVATGLPIDHVGLVVHDLPAEVAAWRAAGFQVSDPVPLMGSGPDGASRPLGQASAHVVFSNGYVELSSPTPGSGNHLEPYLAQGEGVRILVLAAGDAEGARQRLMALWPTLADVREASRRVAVGATESVALFRWFPLPQDVMPGVLTAVVEHGSRDLVLHPSLVAHPNGLSRIGGVIARGRARDLERLPALAGAPPDAPQLSIAAGEGALAITGLVLGADDGREQAFRLA
jgi:hypothetical protein